MSLILYKDGTYQEYSTVCDACLWEHALTLEQLTEVVRQEQGKAGLRDLPRRLARAQAQGCSSAIGLTLDDCIRSNRHGPDDTHMPAAEFIAKFLTLPT